METNQKNYKTCDICGVDATSLCFQCVMYFCESCFKLIHDKQKNSQHIKEKIDYFVPIDLKCPEHPTNPRNLFCVDDKGKIFNFIFIIHYRIMLRYMPLQENPLWA